VQKFRVNNSIEAILGGFFIGLSVIQFVLILLFTDLISSRLVLSSIGCFLLSIYFLFTVFFVKEISLSKGKLTLEPAGVSLDLADVINVKGSSRKEKFVIRYPVANLVFHVKKNGLFWIPGRFLRFSDNASLRIAGLEQSESFEQLLRESLDDQVSDDNN